MISIEARSSDKARAEALPGRTPRQQVACCAPRAHMQPLGAVPSKKVWVGATRGKAWAIP